MAGGGAATSAETPVYLKRLHAAWLANSSGSSLTESVLSPGGAYLLARENTVAARLGAAISGNPFTRTDIDITPANPYDDSDNDTVVATSNIYRMQDSVDELLDMVQPPVGAIPTNSLYGALIARIKNDWNSARLEANASVGAWESANTIYSNLSTAIGSIITAAMTRAGSTLAGGMTYGNLYVDDILSNAATEIAALVSSMSTSALAAAAAAINDAAITAAVNAYETRQTPAHLRSVARWAAGMADVNSVLGNSAFVIGMGNLEKGFQADVDKFSADITMETFRTVLLSAMQNFMQGVAIHADLYKTMITEFVDSLKISLNSYLAPFTSNYVQSEKDKRDFVVQGINTMVSLEDRLTAFNIEASRLEVDMNRLWYVMGSEYKQEWTEHQKSKYSWGLEMHQHAANCLAAMSGASSTVMHKPTKTQSALSGALAGAALGAQMPGATVGGAIGMGIAGLFIGAMSG